MANRIYESMTRVTHGSYTIRVWVTEKEFRHRSSSCYEIEEAITNLYGDAISPENISEVLDTFPNVSAYEILDAEGNGAIVYPDWP